MPRETDLFVVGGGPAGLAVAIAARAKGFRAVVADCGYPPLDKPCGEGLMPDALAALEALGVTVRPEHSFPFRGIRFLGPGTAVDASFPRGYGLGVRRTTLHQLMVDRATEAGVILCWGTGVKGLSAEGVRTDRDEVRCHWVIGADGQNSRVRRWAGLDACRRESYRFGFRRHYRIAPWTDCMEIYWGPAFQIYVTPVGQEEVCVTVISRETSVRLAEAIANVPEIAHKLEQAIPVSAEQGAITASRALKRVFRGNVVLAGDASGSVDAVTGEGLCLAFKQAVALAHALASGDLPAYQSRHRRLARRPALMAKSLLLLDRYPRLRHRVLNAFSSKPEMFSQLLSMHVGGRTETSYNLNTAIP